MPTRATHVNQAARNETFARAVAEAFPDWAVIGLFYAAVHLVDAYLANGEIHPNTHHQREQAIALTPLRQMFGHYRMLQDQSEQARYECRRLSSRDYQLLERNHYQPLERHIERLLGSL